MKGREARAGYGETSWWWWWLFSSLARILGECLTIHSLPVLFFFFLVVEISLHTLIPLCMPGSVHGGSASWNNCLNVPDKLCVSSFPGKFPYYCLDSSIVSPLKLRWMKPTVAVTKAVAGEQLLLGVWMWASVTCYRCKVRNVAHSDTTFFLFFFQTGFTAII